MGSSSGQQQQQGFFGAGTQPAYEQAPVASNSGNLLDGDFFSSAPARPVGGGGGGGVPDLLGLGDFVSSPPAVAAAAHPKPAAAPKPADNWAVFD